MPRNRGQAFANVFEQLRTAAGLSPADVARALDAPDSLVSRWRSGKSVPSLGYLERLADLFKVERNTLERLAGLRANTPTLGQDTINPQIAAMLDAERAQLQEQLLGIPQPFWTAILAAQREARRLAVDMARAAIELTQGSAAISNPSAGELAKPGQEHRENGRGGDSPEGGSLAIMYALAGAH